MPSSGIIFDLKRFAVHDGPGIRTTVFFKGCPLQCVWCHNPESRKKRPEHVPPNGIRHNSWAQPEPDTIGREVTVDELIREAARDLPFFEESGGGITVSGGEPLAQPGFLRDFLAACSQRDIHTVVDTSGHAPWKSFEAILPFTRLFLFDLKLSDPDSHQKWTGVHFDIIHENLDQLLTAGARVRVRIPLIPDITDTEGNLTGLARFLSFRRGIEGVDILPFNPIGEDKYRRFRYPHIPITKSSQSGKVLTQLGNLFRDTGIPVHVGG